MKYKLTDETKIHEGIVLHRIQATKDFSDVKAGDLGGWIESAYNLSQRGMCWIFDDSMCFDRGKVKTNARVKDRSIVCGKATACGNCRIMEYSLLSGDALICGNRHIRGRVITERGK